MMVAFVLANADMVGCLQHPQLLALGNLRVDYSHAKPMAAYGSSGQRMIGSESGSLDPLDGDCGGLLAGPNSIMVPANGASGKATLDQSTGHSSDNVDQLFRICLNAKFQIRSLTSDYNAIC